MELPRFTISPATSTLLKGVLFSLLAGKALRLVRNSGVIFEIVFLGAASYALFGESIDGWIAELAARCSGTWLEAGLKKLLAEGPAAREYFGLAPRVEEPSYQGYQGF